MLSQEEDIKRAGADMASSNRDLHFDRLNNTIELTDGTGWKHKDSMPCPLGGFAKRSFDIVFATLALIAFAVPVVLIAVALKLLSPGPLVFAHTRVGLGGRNFQCLKFRTMVVDAQEQLDTLLANDAAARAEFTADRKLRNDPRIIPGIGHWLRKTSLDELPQFINVLRGDMSIVGPRPVTPDEVHTHYNRDHVFMYVRPGVTGPWQVSGRNDVSYSQRVSMDEQYGRKWSFRSDLAIILKTVEVVCHSKTGH